MDIIPGKQEQVAVDYPYDYNQSLNGIGGWLVLVIIGRILSIILGIKDIFDSTPAFGYNSEFDALLTTSIIIDVVFGILLSGVILYLIFTRNILFRILFVIQVLVLFAFNIYITIYFANLGVDLGWSASLIGSIIGGVIWILYVYNSKRIKNTYIYPKLYPYQN